MCLDLYDREQTPLKRYLAMLGVDPETARDIVQESFLKLHEHLLAVATREIYGLGFTGWCIIARATGKPLLASRNTGRIEDLPPVGETRGERPVGRRTFLGDEREKRLTAGDGKIKRSTAGLLGFADAGIEVSGDCGIT